MASLYFQFALKSLLLVCLFHVSFAARKLNELVQDQPQLLRYHDGALLYGKISVNLIWYGNFKPSQRAIISDFVTSLSVSPSSLKNSQPSVAKWWETTEKYYHLTSKKNTLSLTLGKQILDAKYSLGKSLTKQTDRRVGLEGVTKKMLLTLYSHLLMLQLKGFA
ncbi:hypothetical protein OIU84_013180 [Salix udensis]|uniref:Uncharacterized protein n=1 Tax=Salix udensis TaxID=889485 RepID=A0AAD6JHD7_9ROSI|nr:hypothetical protein OIU84_013180 [Salix udensis]